MPIYRLIKHVLRIAAIPFAVYLVLVTVVYFRQRSMLFFPTHAAFSSRLTRWLDGNRTIGYCREVPNAHTVWLMMHGNAGQAADRDYVLSTLSVQDSLYVLEYPGYGFREGSVPPLAIAEPEHGSLCFGRVYRQRSCLRAGSGGSRTGQDRAGRSFRFLGEGSRPTILLSSCPSHASRCLG
jgi:hypothetical protein